MKRSLYFIVPAVFAFNLSNVSALEIDEKLTLRFLKVSSTKKTVLINRGGEDGLVVGDHAKFFITAGVVARGVSEKVSPSRSVWSLYRIVDPAEIEQDKVLNLKIASPVKITDDPSKSLKEEVIPGGTETMNVEPGVAGEEIMSAEDKDELKDLGINEDGDEPAPVTTTKKTNSKKSAAPNSVSVSDSSPMGSTNYSKTWEVWGTMYFNSLSGTYESSEEATATTSTSASSSSVDFSIGAEKYFMNFDNFLKEVSLNAFIHKRSVESGDSVQSKTDWLEYGGGISYHFYNSASSINRLVGFGTLNGGMGKGTVETTTQVTGQGAGNAPEGTSSFFSVGLGAKYVLNNGFGVRAILDYYSTSETYEYEAYTVTRSLSGPRINFGLSYRF
jgi:hypothetical protein